MDRVYVTGCGGGKVTGDGDEQCTAMIDSGSMASECAAMIDPGSMASEMEKPKKPMPRRLMKVKRLKLRMEERRRLKFLESKKFHKLYFYGLDLESEPDRDFGSDLELEPDRECGLDLQLEPDRDFGLDLELEPDRDCGLDLQMEPDRDCGLDLQLHKDWECGFDPELDPDWNYHHVVSWDEHAVQALHLVRLYEITKEDPVHCVPVRTRFCKFNIALFDFEKESMASCGPPILELTSHDHMKLADSVNVVSFKILKSAVDFPISVFGTVLVRDQVDYKCIYLFKRGKDNPQVIWSPKDMLSLTDPCRGLAVTNGMYFEIDLKIKCGDSGDIDFGKGVIERNVFGTHKRKLMTPQLTSWHSTVQLAYTHVPFAVAANLAVNILEGPRDIFSGEVIAWTSGNKNRIILYDSKVEGTDTAIRDGSVVLSRCLVAVSVEEELLLRICVREGGQEAECFEFTLNYLNDNDMCCRGSYELQVKVEWTAILDRSESGVLRHVGHTQLLV